MAKRKSPELSLAYPLQDARNAILEAGLAVFAEDGFHGATMRKIADRAGVSQPLLHHHFGGKTELWRIVGDRITADFMTYMSNAVDLAAPAPEAVKAMLRSYMNYWREHPSAFRFNHWRQVDGPRNEREARSQAMARNGVVFMQRAQEAGFIRKDMPPGLALIFGGSAIQFWLHSQIEARDALSISGDENLSDEAFLEHVLSLIRSA
jgi:AcrR family transcriptional regulator